MYYSEAQLWENVGMNFGYWLMDVWIGVCSGYDYQLEWIRHTPARQISLNWFCFWSCHGLWNKIGTLRITLEKRELLLFSNCADMYCLGLLKVHQNCVWTKGRIRHQLLATACCESDIWPASKQMSVFYRPDWFTSMFTSACPWTLS
jgi:hypothetical protein